MRTWLYERLATDPAFIPDLGVDEQAVRQVIIPRRSEETINIPGPRFLVFGLGNDTNEDLSEDPEHTAHRQFFTIWIHDEGPTFLKVDDLVKAVKARLIGASDKASFVNTVRWLETSQEFNNDTYKTVFRYCRFQAIIARYGAVTP
jgi:hypothetical protein